MAKERHTSSSTATFTADTGSSPLLPIMKHLAQSSGVGRFAHHSVTVGSLDSCQAPMPPTTLTKLRYPRC